MASKALLINFEYCSGCYSCELACRNEHNFPDGVWGIRVYEKEPFQAPDGSWCWDYVAVPTNLCDGCAEREAEGKVPMCVQTCQAKVMEVGTVEEMSQRMLELDTKSVIFKIG